MIVRLDAAPPEELGGKAAGLARLIELGLPVPPAVVVPASDRGAFDDREGLVAGLGEPLAVRSSAIGEDAAERSAAGQYESAMGVRAVDLPEMVKKVYHSATSDRVAAYRRDSGEAGARATAATAGEPPMAVVIQREVGATRAGVAFSRDPVTGEDVTVVECVFGHGERLVSGEATPDRYHVERDGSVRARLAIREGPTRTLRTLRDDEARDVAALARRAEAGFGRPVDVEFCLDAAALWLVQCRPITTLAPSGARIR